MPYADNNLELHEGHDTNTDETQQDDAFEDFSRTIQENADFEGHTKTGRETIQELLGSKEYNPPKSDRLVRRWKELVQAGEEARKQADALEGGRIPRSLKRAISNGEEAKEKLVRSHMRLVAKIAIERNPRNQQEFEDFFAAGRIGLIKAIDKFDPNHESGASLSTFAYRRIEGAIIDAIDVIRDRLGVTDTVRKNLSKALKAETELYSELERKPTREEIAERAGLSQEQMDEVEEARIRVVSLHEKDAETGKELEEKIGATRGLGSENYVGIANDQSTLHVGEVLLASNFSELESDIVRSHQGWGTKRQTLEEIGIRHELPREMVRQIEARVLLRMEIMIPGFNRSILFNRESD